MFAFEYAVMLPIERRLVRWRPAVALLSAARGPRACASGSRAADGRTLDVLDGLDFTVEPRGFVCSSGRPARQVDDPEPARRPARRPTAAASAPTGSRSTGASTGSATSSRSRACSTGARSRQRRVRAGRADVRARRAWRRAPATSLALVGLEQFADEYPLRSPAACSSAWPSPARWPSSPRSC